MLRRIFKGQLFKSRPFLFFLLYLKENEIEEFKKLILSLGKSEVESQERLIDLTVENLKKLTVESKDDIKNKGNLYKKLITFSGICIGIILI